MVTYIALLRGINVGGHKKVAMSDLRGLLAELGFDDVRSLLQSGNLVFRGKARTASVLERLLEDEVEKHLDLGTTFLVRTAKEWEAIIARNPFREEAESDPGHLVVICLKDAPHLNAIKALQAAIKGPEIIRADGRHLYVVYPAGIGRSLLTNKLIEDKLGTRGTGRNWNTVLKLAVLAHA
ncbi:MAG: DUF1697 domain-containing protein [Chloroflexota bacterium]|nr:DUF1697 domain-containing protein [Chloroflexota bacterium]